MSDMPSEIYATELNADGLAYCGYAYAEDMGLVHRYIRAQEGPLSPADARAASRAPLGEAWCIVRNDGSLLADSTFATEDHAWKITLGWPSPDEIESAKKEGYRAVKVRITEVPENE